MRFYQEAKEQPTEEVLGVKHDQDKPDYTLVPYKALDEVVKVLTYGSKKYSRDNWRHVDPKRYEAAMMRHFSKYMQGEPIDPETGYHHIAHMACSVLFLLENELKKDAQEPKSGVY
jgi:hypothetical protein